MLSIGRPFTLGALYDARSDEIVGPGISLWNFSFIHKYRVVRAEPRTVLTFDEHDSWSDRARMFDLDEDVKATFAAGLIEVEESGKFLIVS